MKRQQAPTMKRSKFSQAAGIIDLEPIAYARPPRERQARMSNDWFRDLSQRRPVAAQALVLAIAAGILLAYLAARVILAQL